VISNVILAIACIVLHPSNDVYTKFNSVCIIFRKFSDILDNLGIPHILSSYSSNKTDVDLY